MCLQSQLSQQKSKWNHKNRFLGKGTKKYNTSTVKLNSFGKRSSTFFRRGTKFSTRKPNASGPWMLDSIPSTKEPESEQTKGLNKETWNMWSESVLDNPKNSDPNPWNKSIHPQWESAHQVG